MNRKLVTRGIRPVSGKTAQEPHRIKSLDFIDHLLEQVVKLHIGHFQAAIIAHMELAIVGVHTVVIFGIFLPNLLRLHGMETGGVVVEEGLHIDHLHDAVVIAGNLVIPSHRAPHIHNGGNCVCLYDLIADFSHQLGEDDFVYAGETLGVRKVADREFGKTLLQTGFFLDISGNPIKLRCILAAQPFGDEIIAIGLVRNGDKAVQPHEVFLAQSARRGGQQHMNRQLSEAHLVAVLVAGSLCDHDPEGILRVVVHQRLIHGICFDIQTALHHGADDAVRLRIFDAADSRHDRKMKLRRCGNVF